MKKPNCFGPKAILLCFGLIAPVGLAQDTPQKMYGAANPFTVEQLPEGDLKSQLEALPAEIKTKAMEKLHEINFHEFDAKSHLKVDPLGGIFVVCDKNAKCVDQGCTKHAHDHEDSSSIIAPIDPPNQGEETPQPREARAPVPIAEPPAYNSKPGAPNHLYLDFNGATVEGTQWNDSRGVAKWECKPYGTDAKDEEFSDEEQLIMFRTWKRVAEDFAPFNINVTTDVAFDPDNPTPAGEDRNRIAWVLMTDTVDKNDVNLPHAGSGGVAYVNVYGTSNFFTRFQPAWSIAPDRDDFLAEIISHEFGHNLGLLHDGRAGSEYYNGHGTGDVSWAPIMGTGYNRNVTQWSSGQYSGATNTAQNDLALIATKLGYRTDDHADNEGSATPLMINEDGKTIVATTPKTDPTNQSPANKGIIENSSDVDVFSFTTGDGVVSLKIFPWRSSANTHGGNLDVFVQLKNSQGTVVATSNVAASTRATIDTYLDADTYTIHVSSTGVGNPNDPQDPRGYTSYGSIGQYFISGIIVEPAPRLRILTITPNIGERGTDPFNVSITGRLFGAGTELYLEKGSDVIQGTLVTAIDDRNMTFAFDLSTAPVGVWNVVVRNPDESEDTLTGGFTIIYPIVEFFYEDFDEELDPETGLPEGWITYSDIGSSLLWAVTTEDANHTADRSVKADAPSVVGKKYLETCPIYIDSRSVDMKFSFWHSCVLERGYDAGVLEFKIDDGEWFDVTASTSGAAFTSNSYNSIVSKSYRSPIADRSAWSGKTDVYIQTIVSLTDSARYAGKTLRARWLLASDNAVASSGWNIDTVVLTGALVPEEIEDDPNDLVVEEFADFLCSGNRGGSVSPASKTYTLTNEGTASHKWTIEKTSNWVSLSSNSGTLPAGESVKILVTINANSMALAAGEYLDTLLFKNLSIQKGTIERDVILDINAIPATVLLSNLKQVYNGSPKSATASSANPSGLDVVVYYDGETEPPTLAGSYPVTAVIVDDDYEGEAEGTLIIAKAAPVVTAWPTVGSSLASDQLLSTKTLTGGTVSVPGTFSFNTPDTTLQVGIRQVAVTFTPIDVANYNSVMGTVTVNVINAVTVPNVIDIPQATAQSTLVNTYLSPRVSEAFSEEISAGNVISQSADPGTVVARGSTVTIVVSKGEQPSPKLQRSRVSNVNNSDWTTVNLNKNYTSPVVVATPIYATTTTPPAVTRIRNVTSDSFDLKLERVDGLAGAITLDVAIVVVNEGVYTLAQHGVKMEAVKYTSTVTASGTGNWVAERRSYGQIYKTPVVVGQVMTSNDSRWSVFWSMGSMRTNPVSAQGFAVGKHVGLDTSKTRSNETIGYIVVEAGPGTMDGVKYVAANGKDIIRGFGDSPTKPYVYSLKGLKTVSTAAVSQTGMDGAEGSWAVLSGNLTLPALAPNAIRLHIAEDALVATDRKHTTEQVSYIVFE